MLWRARMIGYLELCLVRDGIVVDVDVAPATEAVVLGFRGGIAEVVVDIREASSISSCSRYVGLASVHRDEQALAWSRWHLDYIPTLQTHRVQCSPAPSACLS